MVGGFRGGRSDSKVLSRRPLSVIARPLNELGLIRV